MYYVFFTNESYGIFKKGELYIHRYTNKNLKYFSFNFRLDWDMEQGTNISEIIYGS